MSALILWIARATGMSSLLSAVIGYAMVAALAGGGFLGYGAYKHHQGYSAGETHERQAWEKQRASDLAKQAADIADKQRKIDQIEAENAALEQTLDRRRAQAALDAAVAKEAAESKPAIPKSIAKALNGIR